MCIASLLFIISSDRKLIDNDPIVLTKRNVHLKYSGVQTKLLLDFL